MRHVTTRTLTTRTLAARSLVAAAFAVAPVLVMTSTAHAGGARQNTDFRDASVNWVERGSLPGLFGGNVHRGVVFVSDDLLTPGVDTMTGRIEDWRCPAGVVPPELYVVEEPESAPTPCTFRGARELTFADGSATFRRDLTGARVTGTSRATDVAGARAAVSLPVDLTFRGLRPVERTEWVDSFVDDDGSTVTHRITLASRPASVRGRVGSDRLGDERTDVVVGRLHSQKDEITRS